jgi:hypothetical protein
MNSPQFAGVFASSNADARSLSPAEVAIATILVAGLWALQTRSWRRPEVAHEDRQDQIDKPSIAYWRDHSMKMGTILSPWRYDAAARHAL